MHILAAVNGRVKPEPVVVHAVWRLVENAIPFPRLHEAVLALRKALEVALVQNQEHTLPAGRGAARHSAHRPVDLLKTQPLLGRPSSEKSHVGPIDDVIHPTWKITPHPRFEALKLGRASVVGVVVVVVVVVV